MSGVPCFVCQLNFPSPKDFFTHFKLRHSNQVFDSFTCLKCLKEYKSIRSFKAHVQKCFAISVTTTDVPVPNNGSSSTSTTSPSDDTANTQSVCGLEENGQGFEPVADPTCLDLKTALSKAELAFAAKLYSDPLMNRAQVQTIIEYSSEFLTNGFMDVLKERVMPMLPAEPEECSHEVKTMFEILSKPFDGLETEHLRLEAFKETECYVEPRPYIIGSEYKTKLVKGNSTLVHEYVYGQHVPIGDVLKKVLELPGALDEVLQYVSKVEGSDEPFTNVLQGEMWKGLKETQFSGKTVLPLFFEFDDFEPDNSLGSHAGYHKLGSACVALPFLPPNCVSSSDAIYQTDLFLSEDKVFGNTKLFRACIDDLISLEQEGIVVNGKRLYFCMCQIVGDNLGVNEISGFVMCAIGNRPCRLCKVRRLDLQKLTKLDRSLLRSTDDYANDVLQNNVSLTGVKEESAFNRIPSYHVVERPWADYFHDFLEGGCQYGMFHVVKYLVLEKKYLDIATLNSRVTNFNYGPVEIGNRIPDITDDQLRKLGHLKMSGSEMLCFVRHFALMVGDYVLPGDEVWEYYLILREIVSIVFAPFVIREQMPYLAQLISDHHELYIRLFHDTLKLKHHLWLHYPDLMLRNGPMIFSSCLMLERSHRPSKQIARGTNSRRNLLVTIMTKKQLALCERLLSEKPLGSSVKKGPTELCDANLLEDYTCFRSLIFPLLSEQVITVPWVEICGTRYQVGMDVVVGGEIYSPSFARVKHLITTQENVIYFVLCVYDTVGFHEHFASFEVRDSKNRWLCLQQHELHTYQPKSVRVGPDGKKYATLRWQL